MNRHNQIFKILCKENNISLLKVFDESKGLAYIKSRRVEVPKNLNSLENFMVALHEIGHVVNGKIKRTFYSEYLAERYAIETAQKFNINPEQYFERAKNYVSSKLAKAWNRGLKLENLPLEVELFADINIENYLKEDKNFRFKFLKN